MHASMYEVNQSIAGDDREYEQEVELCGREYEPKVDRTKKVNRTKDENEKDRTG